MMDFKNLLSEFLALREWEDEIKFNTATNEWYVTTNIGVKNQPFRLIIEGSNETQILGVFIYFNVSFIDTQSSDMSELISWLNPRIILGHFENLDNGGIRWVHKLDCEGTTINPQTLSINVQHGWDCVDEFSNTIISVALGQCGAREAIDHFFASRPTEAKIIH